jgi:hypothetical protein
MRLGANDAIRSRLHIQQAAGYKKVMGTESEISADQIIIVGVHEHDQDVRLASSDPITCYYKGFTDAELLEQLKKHRDGMLTHFKLKGRIYKIISFSRDGSFTMKLDG